MKAGQLAALRLFYFTAFAALGVYVPIMPRWLEARGVTGLALGIIAACMPVMGLFAPIAFGVMADALSWRGWLLRLASVGALGTMLLLALLVRQGVPPFAALIGCFYLFALFRSPMVQIADLVALEAGGDGYGRQRLYGSLGFMVAAFAAGRFVDARDALMMPLVVAGCLGAALVSALFVAGRATPPSRNVRPSERAAAGSSPFLPDLQPGQWLFFAAAFAWALGHSAYDLCYVLVVRDIVPGDAAGGALWALGVLVEIALLLGSERIFAMFPPDRLLAVAAGAASVRWLAISAAETLPALAVAQPLHALSFGLAWLAFLRLVREDAAPERLGTYQGAFSTSCALGATCGVLTWSHVYRSVGGASMFRLAAVASVVATLFAALYARARAGWRERTLSVAGN